MSSAAARPRLGRDRIAEAAVALADDVGLAATTMRALGERLGASPMALYKHLDGRASLVEAMLDRVLGELDAAPDDQPGDWRGAVRARILACRRLIAAHPWLREALETQPQATPRTLAHMDALIAAMRAGGLDAELVHNAMHALSPRMWGFSRDILPMPAVPDDPDERARALAEFAARYPAIAGMAADAAGAGDGCDEDAEFGFALDLILDGVERRRLAGA